MARYREKKRYTYVSAYWLAAFEAPERMQVCQTSTPAGRSASICVLSSCSTARSADESPGLGEQGDPLDNARTNSPYFLSRPTRGRPMNSETELGARLAFGSDLVCEPPSQPVKEKPPFFSLP